jgi:hypothetical protein
VAGNKNLEGEWKMEIYLWLVVAMMGSILVSATGAAD